MAGQARELPIIISAKNETAAGVSAAGESIRKLANEVNQGPQAGGAGASGSAGQLSIASQKRLAMAADENEKSLKDQAKELGKTAKLIKKGAGAFLAINLVSHALEGAAKGIDDYKENVKHGVPKFQAVAQALSESLPVIGTLAKAIHEVIESARHAIQGKSSQETIEEQKANDQQNREIREKMHDEKNRREGQVKGAGEQGAQSAKDALRLSGLEGSAKAAEEARIERDRKLREAGTVEASAKSLGTTKEQDQVRAQAALMRQAAQQELQDKLNEIDAKGDEASFKRDADSRKRLSDAQREANQAQLEEQGQFVKAKLDKLNQQYDDEIATIQQRLGDEIKEQDPNGPRAKAAQDRAAKESAAAAKKRDAAISQANAPLSEEHQKENDKAQKIRDRQFAVDRQVHDARMDMLHAEGSVGNKKAEMAAKALEIDEKRQQKIREIQELIDKPETTDAQREQLRKAQGAATLSAGIELEQLRHPHEQARLTQFNDVRGGTGIGDLLRQNVNKRDDMTKLIRDDLAKSLGNPDAFFGKLWDVFASKLPQIKAAAGNDDPSAFFSAPNT